ncbi:MAG: MaoC family dehydratase N-terminal domain-containing protein [Alphaproteobacteria bacterium]|nr:MaoC family dehydratase N-terminal domain-containing protein [Alphaproteobacteria bacterium]
MSERSSDGQEAIRRQITAGIAALSARIGEEIASWGPVEIDRTTVSRYWEALGFPGRPRDCEIVPLTLLALLPRRPVDINRDVRPSEQVDNALGNPVNGGTTFTIKRALHIGERVRGRTALTEAFVREGRSGPLGIVVKQTSFWGDDGTEIGAVDRTTIYRGGIER